MKVLKFGKWKQIVALAAGLTIAGGVAVAQTSSESSMRDRIQPVGQVLRAGEGAATPDAGANGGERSGEQVYNQACAACHAGGVLGAPKRNDPSDWAARLPQGMDVLLQHSIEGLNAMPPRGGCTACTDEELLVAIEYMISDL